MKLYNVPRNSMIKFLEKPKTPIVSVPPDDIVHFGHIDGMYSLCYNHDGSICHPAADTEVEVVGKWEHHE